MARLRLVGVRVRQPQIEKLVREQACRAIATVPFKSDLVDIEAVRVTIHLLISHYYRTGKVDARRALRRRAIDEYLLSQKSGMSRMTRHRLYTVGRALYPNEFPPALVIGAPSTPFTPPATADEVATLYSIARSLNPKWRSAMMILLDLSVGVGARAPELKQLRRSEIRTETVRGRRRTLVVLQTAASEARVVPVADPAIATRIEDYAHTCPHERLLAFGSHPSVERNAINRVNERLRERGHSERIDVRALRQAWLQRMATVLPVEQFLYVAGLRRLDMPRELGLTIAGDLETVVDLFDGTGATR
ncbi:hypothetical protein [Gordonia zhaorongruii]|uniref:hypothetical protein n=1 Tax=Gordonia zhaorongruii TaxID=2597659 RepID=UPI001048B794|nr:hypothetical protein [Gordonia zhaorongruii]